MVLLCVGLQPFAVCADNAICLFISPVNQSFIPFKSRQQNNLSNEILIQLGLIKGSIPRVHAKEESREWHKQKCGFKAYLVCALCFIGIAVLEGCSIFLLLWVFVCLCFGLWFFLFVLSNGLSCGSTNVHMWYRNDTFDRAISMLKGLFCSTCGINTAALLVFCYFLMIRQVSVCSVTILIMEPSWICHFDSKKHNVSWQMYHGLYVLKADPSTQFCILTCKSP